MIKNKFLGTCIWHRSDSFCLRSQESLYAHNAPPGLTFSHHHHCLHQTGRLVKTSLPVCSYSTTLHCTAKPRTGSPELRGKFFQSPTADSGSFIVVRELLLSLIRSPDSVSLVMYTWLPVSLIFCSPSHRRSKIRYNNRVLSVFDSLLLLSVGLMGLAMRIELPQPLIH